MAIKGKRKGRARPRAVATAPRPFLVPPRTPPLRRRPVQVFLILLVLGGFAALGAGLRADQDAEERREDVQQFSSQVEAAFSTSGIVQAFGPLPVVLPELQSAFQELEKPEIDPANLQADAARWRADLTDLAESIRRLDVESAELKESRDLMSRALLLYSSVVKDIELAAALDAQGREAALQPIQQQTNLARVFFQMGWMTLRAERELAGIPEPAQPAQPGLPPPGLPPGFPPQP